MNTPLTNHVIDGAHDTRLRAFPELTDAGRATVVEPYGWGAFASVDASVVAIPTTIINRPLLHLPIHVLRRPRLPRLSLRLRAARPRAPRRARRTTRSSAVSSAGSGSSDGPPPAPAARLDRDGGARRHGHRHDVARALGSPRCGTGDTRSDLIARAVTFAVVVTTTFAASGGTAGAGEIGVADATIVEPGDDGDDAGIVGNAEPANGAQTCSSRTSCSELNSAAAAHARAS